MGPFGIVVSDALGHGPSDAVTGTVPSLTSPTPCADGWNPVFSHAPASRARRVPCSAASPATSLRVPRSRAGSCLWPGRGPRRTDGRCPLWAGSEVVLGCAILNRMTALGRPVSSRISCNNARRWRGVDGAGGCPAGAPAGQPIPRVAVRKKARWNRGPSGARCSLVRVALALLHPAHAAAGHRGRRVLLLLGDLRDQRFGGQEE